MAPQKIKNRITIWSNNSTSRYISRRTANRDLNINVYSNVHTSIAHKSQKADKTQMSINRWMTNKMWHICSRIIFSLESKEYLTHAPWMKLEDIMLGETSQSQKYKYSIHVYVVHRVVKFTETETRMVVAKVWKGVPKGWGEGRRKLLFNKCRISAFQDEKICGWKAMIVAQQYERT